MTYNVFSGTLNPTHSLHVQVCNLDSVMEFGFYKNECFEMIEPIDLLSHLLILCMLH